MVGKQVTQDCIYGNYSHQNTNVLPKPGRMSFVRTSADFQSILAEMIIIS